MGLKGKKSVEIEIKSCGDAFHELFVCKPHEASNHAPNLIKGCQLHEGEWGVNGSVVTWTYFVDEKFQSAKKIVHINEEEKWITWEVISGEIQNLYKSILFTAKVDNKGEYSLVTWTIEYEKVHEDIPDPDSHFDFFINLTKAVEESHLKTI